MADPQFGLVACSRTGHRAVGMWLEKLTGCEPHNIEGKSFDDSLAICKQKGVAPVMLLRDFPNWFASMRSWFDTDSAAWYEPLIDRWITHAEAINTVPTIIYHEWALAGHGAGIVTSPHKFVVSKFIGGSTLDRGADMAAQPDLFPVYGEIMRKRTDAVNLSIDLFGPVSSALIERVA